MFANLLYSVALFLVSPMILYRMVRHGRYRRGLGEKLLGLSSARARGLRGEGDCAWIHAVSVGEANLLPGIVQRLREESPDRQFVISVSTDTGYDVAVKHFGENQVFFCPLDFTWAVKRTLRHLSPSQLVLVELELWPNLIRIAGQQGTEVLVINARLSQRSAKRYQQLGLLTRPIFAGLSWVGCQDQVSRERFAACGTPRDRLRVTGSLKFDDAPTSRATPEVQSRAQWAGIDAQHHVWLVGSTQPGEERMALEIYQSLRPAYPQLRLILVPRHRERFDEVASLVSSAGLTVRRRSQPQPLDRVEWNSDTVILVDTIGELRYWWGVAEIATVGGSFDDRGGQNMLEPAGYGCAVSFGPNTRNFEQIARRLIEAGGARRVADQGQLRQFVVDCLTNRASTEQLGRSARRTVLTHRGASDRTVAALCGKLATLREAA